MCIQPEKAELRSDRIPAEALEGACIGSGVGYLVSPLELALYGASLCLALVALSPSLLPCSVETLRGDCTWYNFLLGGC